MLAKSGSLKKPMRARCFWDEIGDTLGETQVALLRVLQDRRLLSNRRPRGNPGGCQSDQRHESKPEKKIEVGAFREDLYQRLSVFTIYLPPLRERGSDLELLTHHFLKQHGLTRLGYIPTITPEAMERLSNFPDPAISASLKAWSNARYSTKKTMPRGYWRPALDEIRQPFP